VELDFEIIVIGSGPAGMTAAIYLKRANINVLMIENNAPGGQINKTAKVENYPGFNSIEGPNLAYNMFSQTQELGIPYRYIEVLEIIEKKHYKIVKTNKEELSCKGVIIATGRKPKELGLENEKQLSGRGISWCAVCDGPLFRNKDVVVVGGGNSALEESLYLTEITNKVILVHRRDEFRGDKFLLEKVINNPKIEIIRNNVITKLKQDNNILTGVEITNVNTNEKKDINASGLFIYIGFIPEIGILKNLELKTINNYLIVDDNMRTNIFGIYACGDVISKDLYQIATAVGEGAKAAISAVKDFKL